MNPTQHVRFAVVSALSALSFSLSAPAIAQPAAPAQSPSDPAAPAVAATPTEAPAPAPTAPAPATASAAMATATPTASAATPRVPPPAARSSQDRQGQLALGGAWNVGFPVASVHHFTNAVSGLGFEFMLRSFVLPQVSLGASADFQSFVATKPRATYQLDNGALTATAYNTVQTVALRGTLHFYALKNGPVLPYAGVTFGLGWSTFQSAAAGLAFYDNQASVLLGADAGALFPITDSSLALLFAVRYLALPVSEFLSVDSVQSVSLQFGLLTL